jgi:hypothetical protein
VGVAQGAHVRRRRAAAAAAAGRPRSAPS